MLTKSWSETLYCRRPYTNIDCLQLIVTVYMSTIITINSLSEFWKISLFSLLVTERRDQMRLGSRKIVHKINDILPVWNKVHTVVSLALAFKNMHRARCSSIVEHPLRVRWVIGSIPHGGPIELFPVPASVPQLV